MDFGCSFALSGLQTRFLDSILDTRYPGRCPGLICCGPFGATEIAQHQNLRFGLPWLVTLPPTAQLQSLRVGLVTKGLRKSSRLRDLDDSRHLNRLRRSRRFWRAIDRSTPAGTLPSRHHRCFFPRVEFVGTGWPNQGTERQQKCRRFRQEN